MISSIWRICKAAIQRSSLLSFLAHTFLRQVLRLFPCSLRLEGKIIAWIADFSSQETVDFINIDKIKFQLNLREYVQARIYCYDYYEKNCVRAFRPLVTNAQVMVDVGANIGQYSLLAAKLMADHGRVISFEPDPDIAQALQKNIDANHFVIEVERCALGDKQGMQHFYPPGWEGNLGQGSLLPAENSRSGIRKKEPLTVEVLRLDDVMLNKGIAHIDFMKIDVEGYEMNVLLGAEKMLSNASIKAMMIEVSPENLKQTGEGYEALLAYLHKFSYSPFVANASGVLRPLVLPILSDVNVFFLQQGAEA